MDVRIFKYEKYEEICDVPKRLIKRWTNECIFPLIQFG